MTKKRLLLFFLLLYFSFAQAQTKIIDMHIHSYTESYFGNQEQATDFYGTNSSPNAETHRQATFAAFKKFNIVKAVVSGNPESVENWSSFDTNKIVI
jgi:hypothetical protein